MQAELTPFEIAFLADLASSKNGWLQAARSALELDAPLEWSECADSWRKVANSLPNADTRVALLTAIEELLSGLSHSFLATLDGATQLAEQTKLEVTAEDSIPFKRFLHEFWPEHAHSEA